MRGDAWRYEGVRFCTGIRLFCDRSPLNEREFTMRSRLGLILIVFLAQALAAAQTEKPTDFRKTSWGMTREQVKAVESSKLIKED